MPALEHDLCHLQSAKGLGHYFEIKLVMPFTLFNLCTFHTVHLNSPDLESCKQSAQIKQSERHY